MRHLLVATMIIALVLGASACRPGATPTPEATEAPTSTATPEATPTPEAALGQWVEGNFFSVKVSNVRKEDRLDGESPTEDFFLVASVSFRGHDIEWENRISGADFALVDDAGERYEIAGAIFVKTDETEEKYHPGWWQTMDVSGDSSDSFKLVYDLPRSAAGLRMSFQELATTIDLGLDPPDADATGTPESDE